MAGGEGAAEEGQGSRPLVKNDAEASLSTTNCRSKSSMWSTGAVKSARLRLAKASSASAVQTKASFRRRHVRGAAMEPKSRMNLR